MFIGQPASDHKTCFMFVYLRLRTTNLCVISWVYYISPCKDRDMCVLVCVDYKGVSFAANIASVFATYILLCVAFCTLHAYF